MMNSKYTTILQNLLDTNFDIGLDKYPIFDEEYRTPLNEKIKEHYAFCEIGFETPEMFKRRLNVKMNEVMPLFNQLYLSRALIVDPLKTLDITETNEKNTTGTAASIADATNTATNSGESNSEGTNKSTGKNSALTSGTASSTGATTDKSLSANSDTPSHLLSINDLNEDSYASGVTRTEADGTNCSNSDTTGISETDITTDTATTDKTNVTGTNTNVNHGTNSNNITNLEEYTARKYGNIGAQNYSQLLLDFRSTFLNIDMQVIDSLKNCFMGVW